MNLTTTFYFIGQVLDGTQPMEMDEEAEADQTHQEELRRRAEADHRAAEAERRAAEAAEAERCRRRR